MRRSLIQNGGEVEAPVRRGPGRPPKALARAGNGDVAAPTVAPKRGGFGKKTPTVIDVSKLMVKPSVMTVKIVGTAPLLVHNFGAKAIRQILDKQTGAAKGIREKKDPFNDFRESLYILDEKKVPKKRIEAGQHWPFVPNTFGFPVSAFKKAMVQACSFIDGISKTWVRGLVHIRAENGGDMVALKYRELVMHQGTVRVGPFGRKVADIRFRGMFEDWECTLKVSYNANAITPVQIAALLNNAGFSVGLGEWRPEKDGPYGCFSIG